MCCVCEIDPVSITLSDSWSKRGYQFNGETPMWGSYKDFSADGPFVEAPKQFLGLLIDGHNAGAVNKKDRRRVATITWNAKRNVWQMKNGYRFNSTEAKEWIKRHNLLNEDGSFKSEVQ